MSAATFLKDLILGPSGSIAADVDKINDALLKVIDHASAVGKKVLETSEIVSKHEQTLQTIVQSITPGCDMSGYLRRLDRIEESVEDIRKLYISKVESLNRDLTALRNELYQSRAEFENALAEFQLIHPDDGSLDHHTDF